MFVLGSVAASDERFSNAFVNARMICYNDQYYERWILLLIKVLIIMGRKKVVTTPSLERIFAELGENVRMARLRRRFSASIVAERAGIARNTLRAIERGDPSVSFGAYANVLFSLGLEKDLGLIAHDDELGRKLQDAGLPTKARAPRLKRMMIPKLKKHD